MDYIEAEDFLKQPKEIQKILKQFHNEYHKTPNGKHIPLMNETELRHFIQKQLDDVSIYYTGGELTIEYECNKGVEDCDVAEYIVECDDILEGYWKIAIMVASTMIKEKEYWEKLDS